MRRWIPEILRPHLFLLPFILTSPFLLFPEFFTRYLSLAAASLLAVSLVGRGLMAGRQILSLVILVLPFLIAGSVNYWASADTGMTEQKLYVLLNGLAAVFLFASVKTAGAAFVRTWTWIFLLGILFLGLVAPFITRFSFPSKFVDLELLEFKIFDTGEVLDANILSSLLGMALPIALSLLVISFRRKERWPVRTFHVGTTSLLSLLLLLCQSRAGIIGACGGGVLLAAFFLKRIWLFALLGLLLGAGLIFWFDPGGVMGVASQTGSVTSLPIRFELWNRACDAIQDFPLTGIGAGTFSKVIPVLYPLFLVPMDATPYHAHNLYLQVAVDLGIPGLVGFVALLAFSLFVGLNVIRGGEVLAVGYLGGLTAFLMNGLLDSPLWLNKPHLVPFFFVGALVALGREDTWPVTQKRVLWHSFRIVLLWLLVSLLGIAFVGEHFYWALGIAIGGGIYIGGEARIS